MCVRARVCVRVCQDAWAHKPDLTVLSAAMRITKHITNTNEIKRTLNYHVDSLAICMYLRQREMSNILNFTPPFQCSRAMPASTKRIGCN